MGVGSNVAVGLGVTVGSGVFVGSEVSFGSVGLTDLGVAVSVGGGGVLVWLEGMGVSDGMGAGAWPGSTSAVCPAGTEMVVPWAVTATTPSVTFR